MMPQLNNTEFQVLLVIIAVVLFFNKRFILVLVSFCF